MLFNEKFIKLRKEKGYTQEELSIELGVDVDTIRLIESGSKEPDSLLKQRITDYFNIPYNYFDDNNVIQSRGSYNQLYSYYNSIHINKGMLTAIIVLLILGAITTPLASFLSNYALTNTFNYFALFDYIITIPVCTFSIRACIKAKSKQDLIGWGIASLILVSLVGGILMLVVNDNSFEGSNIKNNNYTKPNMLASNPEFLVKQADSLYNTKDYTTAYTYYRDANITYGGHNTHCIERIIRCKTNDLNTKIDDLGLINSFISKKEYIEDEEILNYLEIVGSVEYTNLCRYNRAIQLFNNKEYVEASYIFKALPSDYKDRDKYIEECNYLSKYNLALKYARNKKYSKAINTLKTIEEYKDSKELIEKYSSSNKNKTIILIISISTVVMAITLLTILLISIGSPGKYNRALKYKDNNKTAELDRLMLNLTKKDINYFRKQSKNIRGMYFLGKDDKFEYCLGNDDVHSLILESDCRIICNNAFSNNKNLTNMQLRETVEKVGKDAFKGCEITTAYIPAHLIYSLPKDYLEHITIFSGNEIADNAFNGCTKLSYIKINDSITKIGKNAFKDTKIESALIPAALVKYIPKDNLATLQITSGEELEDYALEGATHLGNVLLPKSLKRIGNYAFKGCTNLTYLNIPETLEILGEGAFYDCHLIQEFSFPKNVKILESYTFYNCYNLTNNEATTRFYSVTTIKTNAFVNTYSIRDILLSKDLKLVEKDAFNKMQIFGNIYYGGSPSDVSNITIESGNNNLDISRFIYYSETKPTDTTHRYWHYVNGVPISWN